ncbi:MAG TPA: hypothetical protein VK463_04445 [Desulfomonilaceae bacterium]|nr:hypothetical protein [Desulfomonilaceae bacterium]
MRTLTAVFLAFLAIVSGNLFCSSCLAQDPVKWSAPMQHYPNQWNSTAPPPNYYGNQYGYQDPYANYWYGYGGYRNSGPPQPGFSGNPYQYYYGQ